MAKNKRWKKITGGIHFHRGERYRKGDILVCPENELSEITRRQYKCLDVPDPDDAGSVLKVVKDSDGNFNVVNSVTGKTLNENAMSQEKAEELSGVEYIPSDDDSEPKKEPKKEPKPKSGKPKLGKKTGKAKSGKKTDKAKK